MKKHALSELDWAPMGSPESHLFERQLLDRPHGISELTHRVRTFLSARPYRQVGLGEGIQLSCLDVEQILAMPFPPSVRNHPPSLGRTRRKRPCVGDPGRGLKGIQVNLTDERVAFLPDEEAPQVSQPT